MAKTFRHGKTISAQAKKFLPWQKHFRLGEKYLAQVKTFLKSFCQGEKFSPYGENISAQAKTFLPS